MCEDDVNRQCPSCPYFYENYRYRSLTFTVGDFYVFEKHSGSHAQAVPYCCGNFADTASRVPTEIYLF